ncbi:hypothetical protein ACWC0C_01070 [Streptomyces sp. NPDC001709]
MSRGKIQKWEPEQGEGKIRDDKGGPQLDFTVEDLLNPAAVEDLHKGDTVSFQIEEPGHAVMVAKA